MRHIKNKSGKIFSVLMVLILLIVCFSALFLYITENKKTEASVTSLVGFSKFYSEEDAFKFYAEEAAQKSAEQAYDKLISEAGFAGSECKYHLEYKDYIGFCSVSPDSAQAFINYFSQNFNSMLSDYPAEEFKKLKYTMEVENDVFYLNSEKLHRTYSADIFSVSHEFSHSFSIKLSELGLTLDFQNIHEKANSCKNNADIKTCMNLPFDVSVRKEGSELFFDLETKKAFALDTFRPITIKFTM